MQADTSYDDKHMKFSRNACYSFIHLYCMLWHAIMHLMLYASLVKRLCHIAECHVTAVL